MDFVRRIKDWYQNRRSAEEWVIKSSNKAAPVPRAPLTPEERNIGIPLFRHHGDSSVNSSTSDSAGNETLDISAFIELLRDHRHDIKYLARAKVRMFANESPVNEKKWMDHIRCIECFEQTPELVHSYIQRILELRSYFSCDLVNAVILLVGLVPHDWIANTDMVTDEESGLPGILYARATLSSTIWNVLAYYTYVIFNPCLNVDIYYWILGDESKAMAQMVHLVEMNEEDPYLVFYVKPFLSSSPSSAGP